MMNRSLTAVVRLTSQVNASRMMSAVARNTGYGAMYHPHTHEVFAFNFGTSRRPDVDLVTVSQTGQETIASFLARGGAVKRVAPKLAKGAALVGRIHSRPSRIRTSRG